MELSDLKPGLIIWYKKAETHDRENDPLIFIAWSRISEKLVRILTIDGKHTGSEQPFYCKSYDIEVVGEELCDWVSNGRVEKLELDDLLPSLWASTLFSSFTKFEHTQR